MNVLGLAIIHGVFISYFAMLFVLHRFTYKTWIFDVAVGVGIILGVASWFLEGGSWLSCITIALGIGWFFVTRT